jgi:hypothetical protein
MSSSFIPALTLFYKDDIVSGTVYRVKCILMKYYTCDEVRRM